MKAVELIKALEELVKEHGDLDVVCSNYDGPHELEIWWETDTPQMKTDPDPDLPGEEEIRRVFVI